MTMKYALIGCGRIAKNHLLAAVSNNFDIVAVCDIVPKKMEDLLEKCDGLDSSSVQQFTDYKQMLKTCTEINLVAIATESGKHASIALDVIDMGRHLIIEKPIAMTISDADEIIRRSEGAGVVVSACLQNRFNLAIQKTRKAIEAQRLGKISHGSIHVRWNRGAQYYEQASWRGTWEQDGGCLMNQCIHGIDLLRWMMGDEVEEVYGSIRQQTHSYIEAEDLGMAIIKFKNGALATIEGTTNVYPKNLEETLYLFGETGTIKIGGTSVNNIDIWDFADEAPEDLESKGLKEPTNNIYGNGHIELYRDVAEAIKDGRKPYVDAVAGRNAVELVLAIYKSSKEGKSVKLPLKSFASADMRGEFDD